MEYIVHRRFKDKAICGEVNLPAFTICNTVSNFITYDGKPVCVDTSENAHQYFARNDDGQGMLRGKLTHAIQNNLAKRNKTYQNRWNKIWEDARCQKYKRVEYSDYWLWNHEFFNASIEDLKYIANLIGIKETSL